MSKKRTTTDDNETIKLGVLQNEDNAKRSKLTPLCDKTLQDLPIRLLERIMVKAVVMEVWSMRLAKSVWKEKADLVIRRLTTVCLQWSSIFTAYRFLTEVHRILDGTAQKTIRLELLREHSFPHAVGSFATLKEEIFLTRSTSDQSPVDVEVYERNNMAELKDIIAISGLKVMNIEACNVSNCVYVLCRRTDESNCLSVLRIKKDSEHRYNISTWISDLGFLHASISVLPNGILSVAHGYNPVALKHYDANGSLVLSSDVSGLGFVDTVLQKANGNFVLATLNLDKDETVLTEMDTFGKVRGQYISFIDAMSSSVHFADPYDRIMITDETEEGIELLDSELNLLEFEGRELLSMYIPIEFSYSNSQRNELVFICTDGSDLDDSPRIVSTFRITEE